MIARRVTTDNFIEEVAIRYYITGHSVRRIARHYGISKTLVGKYINELGSKRLPYDIYSKVRARVESNSMEHKRFGKLLPQDDYPPDLRLDSEVMAKPLYEEEDEGPYPCDFNEPCSMCDSRTNCPRHRR